MKLECTYPVLGTKYSVLVLEVRQVGPFMLRILGRGRCGAALRLL